jgi:hypothetical protein
VTDCPATIITNDFSSGRSLATKRDQRVTDRDRETGRQRQGERQRGEGHVEKRVSAINATWLIFSETECSSAGVSVKATGVSQ